MVHSRLISINVYQECYLLVCMSMPIILRHVFKMSASRMQSCFESHTLLVNGCVDDVLFNADPNVQQTLSQFVNILNLCLVDALLHNIVAQIL